MLLPLWKTVHSYLQELDTRIPCNQLSRSYEQMWTYVSTKTCTHMLPKRSAAPDRNRLETTQMSINGRMDEESVVYSPRETLRNEKE